MPVPETFRLSIFSERLFKIWPFIRLLKLIFKKSTKFIIRTFQLMFLKLFLCFSSYAGRIKQLIELDYLSTASIRLFILDEADKLLEEGSFQEQIK